MTAENSDLMYRLLVQGVVDYAIYMLTPEGIVSNWNAGAERAKGYRAAEIVGQHFSRFYGDEDKVAGLPAKNLALATNTGRFEDEGWRIRKDGSAFWAHVVIDAIRDESGHLIGFAKITRDCTEQRRVQQTQREQERRFRLLVQGVTDYAIYMLDVDGHVVNWNAGAERAKGYKTAEIVGRNFSVFYTEEDRSAGLPQRALEIARQQRRYESEGWRLRKDGSRFWTNVVIDALHDDDGSLLGFAKITRDITERRQQQLKLVQAKELAEQYSQQMSTLSRFLDSVIANIPASVLVLDRAAQRILLANQQAQRLFGQAPKDWQGQMLRECLTPGLADYIEQQALHPPRDAEARTSQRQLQTFRGTRTVRSRTVLGSRPDGEGDYVLVITEDVTDELAAYAQIHHMTQHDGLTNLPNRTSFNERLQEEINEDQLMQNVTAILCLDVDHFQDINDALGHAFGDKILLALVKRLDTYLRAQDTLARLGGDEFAVVLPGLKDVAEASMIAQRLLDAMVPAFVIDGHSFSVRLSIGIASTVSTAGEAVHAEQLLRHGDMALHEAKRKGRNRFELFRPELEEASRIRREMEIDLRSALQQGQLQMVYQPVIDSQHRRISGYEALMRWQHPRKGQIPPMEFITLAEETGLIHELGAHALTQACHEACTWSNQESVAVNLSPIQFRNQELVNLIALALTTSGLAPQRLELEITESVLLDDSDANIRMLKALKQLGVRIALDDFGTGYSSLGYLRSFPFDRIKIDKSFVRDMQDSREALAIIRAITGLSSSLLMKTTAEGVETREQYERLKEEGCSHFQGYLFGRPEPTHKRLRGLDALDIVW